LGKAFTSSANQRMLDDSEDFCDVKKAKKTSTSAAEAVPSNSKKLIWRVQSKWEGAPFVKKLRQILEESRPERQISFEFVASSPLKASSNNVSIVSGLESQADLEVAGLSVLILTEPEFAGGNSLFKRRLAKFYSVKKGVDSVVVCVRSPQTQPRDFFAVQTFAVIELGLALIPIADNLERHLPQLLLQLLNVQDKKKKNPFKLGLKAKAAAKGPLGEALGTLQSVPGLGENKAKALLEKFGSLQAVGEADATSLTPVVGHASANSIVRFFRVTKEN